MLGRDMDDLSPAVGAVSQFLSSRGIWFQLSRNPSVRSCAEAAHHRKRLGTPGIPIYDELKSFFARYEVNGVGGRLALLHCRADQELDMDAVATALGASGPVVRLSSSDGASFGVEYGTVHPFRTTDSGTGAPIQQVFDHSVKAAAELPGTMMTNAGDLTWGLEFKPDELVRAMVSEGALVAPIAANPSAAPMASRPAIGIVTGNGPDSGIALWENINRAVRDRATQGFQGDLSLPSVHVRSVPAMGLSMELDRRADAVWRAMEEAFEGLCREGAGILCLACHTTHYFTPRIRQLADRHGAVFVSMVEVATHRLQQEHVRSVALLGVRYVLDIDEWSAYSTLRDAGVAVEVPTRMEQALHDLAYDVKRYGPTHKLFQKLTNIVNGAESEHVLIALTELSLLVAAQPKPGRSGKTVIDGLDIYGQAIADAWIRWAVPSGKGGLDSNALCPEAT